MITAYYHASSGGRTEAVQDAWPGQDPAPYLVPVGDPFDGDLAYHRWERPAAARGPGEAVPLRRPRPPRRARPGGPRAARPAASARSGRARSAANAFRRKLGLRSTLFSVDVLSLDPPAAAATFGEPLALRGFLRGIGGVVLQERSPTGAWRARHPRAHARRRPLRGAVRPRYSTAFRLAVDGTAGAPVEVEVARQIDVRVEKGLLAGTISARRDGADRAPRQRDVAAGADDPRRAVRASSAPRSSRAGQYRAADGAGRPLPRVRRAARSTSVARPVSATGSTEAPVA